MKSIMRGFSRFSKHLKTPILNQPAIISRRLLTSLFCSCVYCCVLRVHYGAVRTPQWGEWYFLLPGTECGMGSGLCGNTTNFHLLKLCCIMDALSSLLCPLYHILNKNQNNCESSLRKNPRSYQKSTFSKIHNYTFFQ